MKQAYWLCTLGVFVLFLFSPVVAGEWGGDDAWELALTNVEHEGLGHTFVEGLTRPGALVVLTNAHGYSVETIAREDGSFGFYDIPLVAEENRLEISATWQDHVITEVHWVRASSRPVFFGAGTASLEMGSRRSTGDVSLVEEWHEGLYVEVDTQLFVSGHTGGYELTFSADRSPQTTDSAFAYPVMGDTSTRNQMVNSSSPIYLELAKEESFFLWGDYRTDFLGSSEFIAYNRLLTGARARLASGSAQLDVARSTTDTAAHTDLLPGRGVSGFYYLTLTPVIEYSEQVSLETMDREDETRAIGSQPMMRHIDYEIDYRLGTIVFHKPVPMRDVGGNPVFVSVTYEHTQGDEHDVTAGSYVWERDGARLALAAVNEGDFTVTSGRVSLVLRESQSVRAEVAHSHDDVDSGWAWLVGWDTRIGDNAQAMLVYKATDAWFRPNPSAGGGVADTRFQGEIQLQWDNWQLSANVEKGQEEAEGYEQDVTRWRAQAARAFDRLTLTTRIGQTVIHLDEDTTKESALWVGTDYQVSEKTTVSAGRREVFDETGTRGQGRWDVAASHRIAEGLIGRAAYWHTDDSQGSALLALDSEVVAGENGTTRLTTSRELSQTDDGWQLGSTYGMTSTLALSPHFGVDLRLERHTPADDVARNAGAVGWQYRFTESPTVVSGRIERRTRGEVTDNLLQLRADGRYASDVHFRTEYRLVENQVEAARTRKLETGLISLAYRPEHTANHSALALWRVDRGDPADLFGLDAMYVSTVSVEGAAWVRPCLEIAGKLAVRSAEQTAQFVPTIGSLTMLRQVRATYRLLPRLDVLYTLRYLTQDESDSVRQSAAGGVSYHLTEDGMVRVEAGYRSDGYDEWADDPSRSQQGSVGGPYVRFMVAF